MIKSIILAIMVIQLAGCASLLDDNKQSIKFTTSCGQRYIRASCTAENTRGRWEFTTPNVVVIENDIFGLRVTCRSAYAPEYTAEALATPKFAFAGNILIGGLLGAAVDMADAKGFEYPDAVHISNPYCKRL